MGSPVEVAPPSEVGPPSEVAEEAGIGQANLQWVGLGQGNGRGLEESESWMSSIWRRYHRLQGLGGGGVKDREGPVVDKVGWVIANCI